MMQGIGVGAIIGGALAAGVIVVYYGTRVAIRHIRRILREDQ